MNQPKNHVTSFSGGLTSGYMLKLLLDTHGDAYRDKFHTIFCNTGREHDKTLDFVHRVETEWGVPITWLEYRRIPASDIDPLLVPDGRKRSNLLKAAAAGEGAHWFIIADYETATRRGTWGPFDDMLQWAGALPNVRTRQCSVQMKVRTMQRYLFANGVAEYKSHIGIRTDEAHRKLEILANLERGEDPQFPLIDNGINKAHVEDFWTHNHFTLDIPNYQGNCDGCFLKARWKRLAFARDEPEHARWWASKEDVFAKKCQGDGALWQTGKSYEGLILEANHPELPLDYTEEDIPCSCAVGGYRGKDGDE